MFYKKLNNILKIKSNLLFKSSNYWKLFHCSKYSTKQIIVKKPLILGIETSCDDTGAAIIDANGTIHGECLNSQQNIHLKYGGIIPPKAQQLHRQNIQQVIDDTFKAAASHGITWNDIDAIAVTNRPGLELSLLIGIRYAKHLARLHGNKPIIPIHHMEAHALTARIEHKTIEFPFLCLLASGGHCLLALVKNVSEFLLLGESLDDAPGEAFDKIARRLKLRNLPEYEWLSGGQSIEHAAKQTNNTTAFEFALPLSHYRNCQFSFAGLKNMAQREIIKIENQKQLAPDQVIPEYREFCNSFLKGMTRHICHRTQRAIEYCLLRDLFKSTNNNCSTNNNNNNNNNSNNNNNNSNFKGTLVVSGGCASNDYLFTALQQLTEQFDMKIYRPNKRLCTDNGIMIAWNGIERYLATNGGENLLWNYDELDANAKCKLGVSMLDDVRDANINCKWVKIPILRQ